MLLTKTDSNIEVTNGKVISNGSSNIIMAVAALDYLKIMIIMKN